MLPISIVYYAKYLINVNGGGNLFGAIKKIANFAVAFQ